MPAKTKERKVASAENAGVTIFIPMRSVSHVSKELLALFRALSKPMRKD